MKFYRAHLAAYHRDRLFSTILVSHLQPLMGNIGTEKRRTRTECAVLRKVGDVTYAMHLFKENYYYYLCQEIDRISVICKIFFSPLLLSASHVLPLLYKQESCCRDCERRRPMM